MDGSVRRLDTTYDTCGRAYLVTSYANTTGTSTVNQFHSMRNKTLWFLTLILLTGCQSKPNKVHFVFPDGFRGALLIYYDTSDGVVFRKSNGGYRVVVPSTGIMRIQGDGPFFRMGPLTASFADGTEIPIAWEPEKLAEATVAFWSGGSRSDGYLYDFVGTKSEYRAFRKATGATDIPPGGVRK